MDVTFYFGRDADGVFAEIEVTCGLIIMRRSFLCCLEACPASRDRSRTVSFKLLA